MLAGMYRRQLRRADRGEVGVGTLIVFIAMVLVAAVAAAVIIGTSGSLQQRAQATGKEATADVSSNLMVHGVWGQRNSTSHNVWNLHVYLALSAGAIPVDLNQTIVRYGDGSEDFRNYKHDDFENYGFTLTWVRGSGQGNVAQSGDLVDLNFTMKDRELPPRTDFEIHLLQNVGSPIQLAVRMPPTYASDTQILIK